MPERHSGRIRLGATDVVAIAGYSRFQCLNGIPVGSDQAAQAVQVDPQAQVSMPERHSGRIRPDGLHAQPHAHAMFQCLNGIPVGSDKALGEPKHLGKLSFNA